MMLASQVAMASRSAADKMDRAKVDSKKATRSVRQHAKKTGRSLTGQESASKDMKDMTKDGFENTKDEAEHFKKQTFPKRGE